MSDISETWKRIRRWEKRSLPVYPKKQRGKTATQITSLKSYFPNLPNDICDSLADTGCSDSPIFSPWTLHGELPREWQDLQEWLSDDVRSIYDARGPVKAVYLHPEWIPFAYDGGGNHLCIDLAPAPGGNVGQVVEFIHDDNPRTVLAPSFAAWLERYADDLETNQLVWSEDYQEVQVAAAQVDTEHQGVLADVGTLLLQHSKQSRDRDVMALPKIGVVSIRVLNYGQKRKILGFRMSGELRSRLNPGLKPSEGENPYPDGSVGHMGFESDRTPFCDPEGMDNVGWLATTVADAAFEKLFDVFHPETTVVEFPEVGEFRIVEAKGQNRVVLKPRPAFLENLNAL